MGPAYDMSIRLMRYSKGIIEHLHGAWISYDYLKLVRSLPILRHGVNHA